MSGRRAKSEAKALAKAHAEWIETDLVWLEEHLDGLAPHEVIEVTAGSIRLLVERRKASS